MSNVFTLEAMRASLESEFAPFVLDLGEGDVVTLRNVLRLPKTVRKRVVELLDRFDEMNKADDKDKERLDFVNEQADIATEILGLVADRENALLVELLEQDMMLALKVFGEWIETTQAGEAEGSES